MQSVDLASLLSYLLTKSSEGVTMEDPLLDALADSVRQLGSKALSRERSRRNRAEDSDDEHYEEFWATGAFHPEPRIRRVVVELAAEACASGLGGEEMLLWTIHDPDDQTSIFAASACKDLRLRNAVPELAAALDLPPGLERVAQPKLMTLREQVLHRALMELLDAQSQGTILSSDPADEDAFALSDLSEMTVVPAGTFTRGVDEAPQGWFPCDDAIPTTLVFVDDFYIQRTPVTNKEYDDFVQFVTLHGHAFCHYDEDRGHDHRRATRFDPRARPEHPVSGVDWYDAYAYAAWRGLKLPTADQWEKAARGPESLPYPWGDDFEPDACNWAGVALLSLSPDWADLREISQPEGKEKWLRLCLETNETFPDVTTRPSADFPNNRSGFDMHDAVGNVWEWTASRYLDDAPFAPSMRGLPGQQLSGEWSAFVCVKGGSWTGAAEMLLPAFRGKRHALHRGSEVGFRCASY